MDLKYGKSKTDQKTCSTQLRWNSGDRPRTGTNDKGTVSRDEVTYNERSRNKFIFDNHQKQKIQEWLEGITKQMREQDLGPD